MSKPFSIHDWQAKQIKQRLDENDDAWQKRQDRLTPGKNPDAFYGDDSIMGKLKKDPDYIKKLNAKNAKKESIGESKYGGMPIRDNVMDYASQILNQINDYENNVGPGEQMIDYNATREAARALMNAVDRDEENIKEMSATGTGASVGAGGSEAFATPNAFKKKRK